jgi:hypothetical protein
MISVYIPTLGRKHKLRQLVQNIREATTLDHKVIFVCENHDQESIDEARKWGDKTYVNHGEPSYSNSLQTAYEADDAPYFIGANDDFDFRPGWDVEAMKVMETPGVQVVGLFDGNPSCNYSTISLVERAYIEVHSGVIDMPGRVNYPYKHNYVDTEFYCTAVHRGVFAPAPDSWVLHIHPDFGHGQYDKTYMKSRASFSEDAQTFVSRRHLWTG